MNTYDLTSNTNSNTYDLKYQLAVRIANHLVKQLRLTGDITNDHLGSYLFDRMADALASAPDELLVTYLEDVQQRLTEEYSSGRSDQSLGTQSTQGVERETGDGEPDYNGLLGASEYPTGWDLG